MAAQVHLQRSMGAPPAMMMMAAPSPSPGLGPPPRAGPPPPSPWTALKTEDGKHTYYHNRATNETTWTRPPGFVDPAAPAAPTQIPVANTGWFEVAQPGGPSYFHNPTTGEVTWTAPPAVLSARGAATLHAATPAQVRVQDEVNVKVKDEVQVGDEPAPAPASVPVPVPVPVTSVPAATADEDEDVDFDPDAYEDFEAPPSEPEPVERMVRVGDYLVPASALAPEFDDGAADGADAAAAETAADAAAETAAAPVPPEDPKDAARRAFDELLREKGVDEKTRWDRAVHKMSSDPRFHAIPTHAERRRLFERFGRRVADDKKQAKATTAAAAAAATAAGRSDGTASAPSGSAHSAPSEGEVGTLARRDMERRRREDRARRAREEETRRLAEMRRAANRDAFVENFRALLAETIRSAETTWEEANARMATDAAGRGRWEGIVAERDARDLFRRRVDELTTRAEEDARTRLEETLVAVSAEDFAPVPVRVRDDSGPGDGSDSDEGDAPSDANPLNSFVAAAATEGLAGDPRWERCPLERRAALYVAHVERLCAKVGVDVPEDVAALRDELARERNEAEEPRRRDGEGRGTSRDRNRGGGKRGRDPSTSPARERGGGDAGGDAGDRR